MKNIKILIVDDETKIRMVLRDLLAAEGYKIVEAENGEDAVSVIEQEHPALVILDLLMPKMSGLEVLEYIREHHPELVVIVLTAYGSVESAVEAMKLGAFDYIIKTEETDRILMVVKHSIEQKNLYDINKFLLQEIDKEHQMVVGNTPQMSSLLETVKKIGQQNVTVLIEGESGTGKQLLAWTIHKMSKRKNKPFVHVNCATLSETLIESDLFGHEKGAFTGAIKQKQGRFELADGGTIFLDEIGELSQNIQAKLLTVIEYKTFQRVGGLETLNCDVRIIAATNRNLAAEVENGIFRKDLFYRLKVFRLRIPPLRERRDDLLQFADFFIKKHSRSMNKHVTAITPEAMDLLYNYSWPGNIRELENIIERAIVLASSSKITPDLINPICTNTTEPAAVQLETTELAQVITDAKKNHIIKILKMTDNNQTKAAELMDIQRTYLNKLMREFDIR